MLFSPQTHTRPSSRSSSCQDTGEGWGGPAEPEEADDVNSGDPGPESVAAQTSEGPAGSRPSPRQEAKENPGWVQKPGWKCAPRGGGAEPGGGLTRGQQDGPQEPLDLARPPPQQGHSLCAVVGTQPIGYRGDTGDRKRRLLFRGDFCTREEAARGRGQARREVSLLRWFRY